MGHIFKKLNNVRADEFYKLSLHSRNLLYSLFAVVFQKPGVAFWSDSQIKIEVTLESLKEFEVVLMSLRNIPETLLDSFDNVLEWLPLFWNDLINFR